MKVNYTGIIWFKTGAFLATLGIEPMTLCLQGGHANHLNKSPDRQPSG